MATRKQRQERTAAWHIARHGVFACHSIKHTHTHKRTHTLGAETSNGIRRIHTDQMLDIARRSVLTNQYTDASKALGALFLRISEIHKRISKGRTKKDTKSKGEDDAASAAVDTDGAATDTGVGLPYASATHSCLRLPVGNRSTLLVLSSAHTRVCTFGLRLLWLPCWLTPFCAVACLSLSGWGG